MPVIPGGKIIGGMGGGICFGPMGTDPANFDNDGTNDFYLDVDQWSITRQWINADCTHSGTYGAVTRRNVAFDWHFQASVPLDQVTIPETLLAYNSGDDPNTINLAAAFFLGDTARNQEAIAMEMEQKFYYAPMCIIRSCQPVLNAARDVIRCQISGEGNSRLWLIPNEETACSQYLTYLKDRGWWV